MDYSLPGSSVHGIFQARILEWGAIAFSVISCSVQFSRSVMSDSLWPHESQHARPPCPSPTPRVYSNSCPLSWWCHPTISTSQFSSVTQLCPTLGQPHELQHARPPCPSPNMSITSLSITKHGFTQTQVHQLSDAIQPSHPLSSPSPPAPNPSQH